MAITKVQITGLLTGVVMILLGTLIPILHTFYHKWPFFAESLGAGEALDMGTMVFTIVTMIGFGLFTLYRTFKNRS